MRANYVLLIVISIMCGGVVFFSCHRSRSHEAIMDNAIRAGLQQAFAKISKGVVDPNELRAILDNTTNAILPSFVKANEVLIGTAPVSIPSDELLFVVMHSENCYALTARGEIKIISQHQVGAWPHRSLSIGRNL